METRGMSAAGPLMKLDVDNGLALDDWRLSGLGPSVAVLFERQVLGEYPHPEQVMKTRLLSTDPVRGHWFAGNSHETKRNNQRIVRHPGPS